MQGLQYSSINNDQNAFAENYLPICNSNMLSATQIKIIGASILLAGAATTAAAFLFPPAAPIIAAGSAIAIIAYTIYQVYQQHKRNQVMTPNKESQKLIESTANPILPDEVLPDEVKKPHQTAVQTWLDRWKQDFVAHAVWDSNFSKVVKDGVVLPSEAILRKNGSVECEIGSGCGMRGIVNLPVLTENELAYLEVLDDGKEKELIELLEKQKKDPYTSENKKELKELENRLFSDGRTIAFDNPLIYENGEKFCKVEKFLNSNEFNLYKELLQKKKQYNRIKFLQRTKQGIRWNIKRHEKFFLEINFKRQGRIDELKNKHDASEGRIRMAYDKQRGNIVDNYLSNKFNRWAKKGDISSVDLSHLFDAREDIIYAGKINQDVRTQANHIDWDYGKIAVLRGNIKECRSVADTCTTEVALKRPFENNGEFFGLPLAQPDTLILGYYKQLSPFAESLDKMHANYAYIESLTEEQKQFFVP